MDKNIKKIPKSLILIILLSTGILIALWLFILRGILNDIETLTYDWRAKLATEHSPLGMSLSRHDPQIVLLAADDKSTALFENHPGVNPGRWPWSRGVWGDVVNFVDRGHPRAIVFDLKFEGGSKTDSSGDRYFADAIKGKNVVIATALSAQEDPKKVGQFFGNITFYQSSQIYPELAQNAQYMGVINLQQSENTVFRRHVPLYRLVHSAGASLLPSLPLAATISVLPKDERKPIRFENNRLLVGKRSIPVDNSGSILLNWHGKGGTYENIPVAKVILSDALEKGKIKTLDDFEKISPDYFKNKIVVIGQTSAGTDIHPTPMTSVYPGPEIIATAIDNLLNDTDVMNPHRRGFIEKPPFYAELLLAFSLCFIIGYAMIKIKSNISKFYIFVLSIIAFFMIAISLFIQPQARIWLNMTYPVIFMIGTGIGSYMYMSWRDAKSRKHIELMFGRFVSPQVLKMLLSGQKEISLEGQRKVMTVLFSDIRGFTSLSERNAPDVVINTLNEYLSEMVEVILSYNGTLDKFIGDAIMAFYNDPVEMEDHALRAVETAIAMKKRLAEINKKWFAQGKPFLSIGIGINTGDMIVGHVGSSRLVDYTVIGDNVNLASRIESLTKEYGVTILISESTYEAVKESIETRYIDEVKVKGRETPVKIYEVLGLK